ncbi:hypothetical protein QQ008_08260 [Fulvivirgaceae bacterium BMA10]|uniref:Uncharacterized protein n=1 Tax=Splendidivirga corallicola TaxID=3051826 RepID=A0ABT8KKV4_9BACT|nr:hypothetical protein [Fulvivirgaceae bacterium BMA10]
MKNLVSAIVLSFVVGAMCFGQECKFVKNKKKLQKYFQAINIEKMTKPKVLFDKWNKVASSSFIKTDQGFLWSIFLMRGYSARFEIFENNPIIVQFENGSIVKLYPNSFTEGKFPVLALTTFTINPLYKIDKDQIDMFSSNRIKNIRVYFTSEKVLSENRSEDDLGTYFEYEILSERYQSNCITPANCILQ